MFEEKLFYCTESENSYTLSEMEKARQDAIENGDTLFTNSIESFINACLVENNGTLETIKKEYSISENGIEIFSKWNIRTDLF